MTCMFQEIVRFLKFGEKARSKSERSGYFGSAQHEDPAKCMAFVAGEQGARGIEHRA